MPFIGNKPSAVPLTSADIADGIITSAKITDATITNSDVASSIITGQTAETSIAGGDSVLIYDDSASALRKMTRTNFVSGIGGTNAPAFFAIKNATQSPSNNAGVKITYETEIFDTNSAFASSRFTVPSGQAGRYFLFFQYLNNKTGVISENYGYFLLNGSSASRGFFDFGGTNDSNMNAFVAVIFNLSVGDYVEVEHYSTTTDSSAGSLIANYNTFGGYKIIE
jgi:hypothetical protein